VLPRGNTMRYAANDTASGRYRSVTVCSGRRNDVRYQTVTSCVAQQMTHCQTCYQMVLHAFASELGSRCNLYRTVTLCSIQPLRIVMHDLLQFC